MPILAKYEKQPADVQDYDVDYNTLYLTALGDSAPGPTGLTATVSPTGGLTIDSTELAAGIAKVWCSGGVDGTTYKITTTLVTTGGRTKQAEISVKVKEV